MKNCAMLLLSLLTSIPAFAGLKCVDETNFTIKANLIGETLEVTPAGEVTVKLNQQMTSDDGKTYFFTSQAKRAHPLRHSVIKDSTVLITYKHSQQAILVYQGDSYSVFCSK